MARRVDHPDRDPHALARGHGRRARREAHVDERAGDVLVERERAGRSPPGRRVPAGRRRGDARRPLRDVLQSVGARARLLAAELVQAVRDEPEGHPPDRIHLCDQSSPHRRREARTGTVVDRAVVVEQVLGRRTCDVRDPSTVAVPVDEGGRAAHLLPGGGGVSGDIRPRNRPRRARGKGP